MEKIVALVPMRHTSQRIHGKNYRELAGKPLFHHIMETLSKVEKIAQIVVDTDSLPVIEGVSTHFPEVIILERPEELRANDIPMNEILTYDTSQVEADFYLQTHSTNPLLRPETISSALDRFLHWFPAYDSLFSVTRLQTRLWDQLTRPVNHNPEILLQTQDLPPIYEENSCMYIFTRDILVNRRNRLGERPLMYEVDSMEAWDIDEELDFLVTDFLMQQRVHEEAGE